jgi:integrase
MLEPEADMTKVKLRYLTSEKSRHGKLYIYVRLPGRKKIRLRVDGPDDPHLAEAYTAARRGEHWSPPAMKAPSTHAASSKALPGSFRALCQDYCAHLQKDPQVSPRTKYTRRIHLEHVCQEPTKPGAPYLMGDVPARKFGPTHVIAVRDRKLETPEAANNRHKALSAAFRWALERRLVDSNPALQVSRIKTHSEGFTPWTREDIDKFEERHPVGTKARLAMGLLFYTDQRRGDVVLFGRQHVRDNAIHFVQQKNQARSPKKMIIPIAPELKEIIEASPRGDMTFLVTERGKPFTAAGFGNWFRDRCDEAGLKGLSAHGLRKALQNIGAEAGLSDRELMAIAGHETTKMTSLYTKQRDRALLAESGMAKLSKARFGNKSVQPENGLEKVGQKQEKN